MVRVSQQITSDGVTDRTERSGHTLPSNEYAFLVWVFREQQERSISDLEDHTAGDKPQTSSTSKASHPANAAACMI